MFLSVSFRSLRSQRTRSRSITHVVARRSRIHRERAQASFSAMYKLLAMQCEQKQYAWRPGYQDYHDFTGNSLDYPFDKYVSY